MKYTRDQVDIRWCDCEANRTESKRCYRAFVDRAFAGSAQVSDQPEEGQPADTRYVTVVSVEEQHRRRGVAKHLYDIIEKHLNRRGLRLVESQHQDDDGGIKEFWQNRKERQHPG
jgi:ribosomal protein S18 acetylase RimI-like enzyme